MPFTRWITGRIQEIDHDECLELLRSQKVGRIAFADEKGPDVLPVNFVTDGPDVLIATTSYGVIGRSATNTHVAFEVDEIDEFTQSGWSVVVRGTAVRESPFEAPSDRPQPWAEGTRTLLLRIRPDAMTGRRVLPS